MRAVGTGGTAACSCCCCCRCPNRQQRGDCRNEYLERVFLTEQKDPARGPATVLAQTPSAAQDGACVPPHRQSQGSTSKSDACSHSLVGQCKGCTIARLRNTAAFGPLSPGCPEARPLGGGRETKVLQKAFTARGGGKISNLPKCILSVGC